jgi:hypothetical protein
MTEMNFNEEDKQKFIDFLNFVAKNAIFNNFKTADIINYYKLLNYMQIKILPKIDSHILEIKRIVETKSEGE